MKKVFTFLFAGLMSLSSFSYMELSFGVGTIDFSSATLDGNASTAQISFRGYTDNNVVYAVGYSTAGTDIITGGAVYDTDLGVLSGTVGYGFGDLSEGAFVLAGSLTNTSVSVNGINGDDFIDTSGVLVELGYIRMADEGINYGVGLNVDIDDCDDNCETLIGSVDIPIGDSNWMFGFGVGFQEDITSFNLGPSLKF